MIEKPVLDGLGWVDVVLNKGGHSIACEISVNNTSDYELGNLQKCLAAGFEHVIFVGADKDVLGRVRTRAAAVLNPTHMKKVQFVLPEHMLASISVLETRFAPHSRTIENSEELLTAKEVEELLRIDVKTIYGYVQKGLMPYVRIQSNLRFSKPDVLAWLAEHRSSNKSGRKK